MPHVNVTVNLDPLLTEQPNVRYANTFLSDKYRDYAVNGEAIMDKVSGEYFIKRVTDGRVVSFSQNKKYIHDTVFELKVALANYPSFTYPYDSESTVYISQNYDLASINNELSRRSESEPFIVALTGDINTPTNENIVFNISEKSNGFFCKPMSRDCDKALIEYYGLFYNSLFETYYGDNENFKIEAQKFIDNPQWKHHDAIIDYQVIVTRNNHSDYNDLTKTYFLISSIKLNEEICVFINDEEIQNDFEGVVDKITIQIQSIDYYKMNFIKNHINDIREIISEDKFNEFMNTVNKLKSGDDIVQIGNLNIMYFLSDANDILLCDNEFIIAFLSMVDINFYFDKLKELYKSPSFILSSSRPSTSIWGGNTIWGENLREIGMYGESKYHTTDSSFMLLQQYFGNPHVKYNSLSNMIEHESDFVLIDREKV